MKFALAGNPNSGKTTLFNTLTGSNAHVGNWPGVTVDKRVGIYKKLPEKVEIIDLPGVYSMSPYTPEELVARNVVLDDDIDVIINIIDATNLERNLYLTTQLLELDKQVIIALNMIDVVDKEGYKIDVSALEKSLGVPIISISALKSRGIKELMEKAYLISKQKRKAFSPLEESPLRDFLNDIVEKYQELGIKNSVFKAVKMLDNDSLEIEENQEIYKLVKTLKDDCDISIYDGDISAMIADIRYKHIVKNYSIFLYRIKTYTSKSENIDRVLTHKFWGIPIFLAIMLFVFHITFGTDFLFLSVWIPSGSFNIPFLGEDMIASPGTLMQAVIKYLTDLALMGVNSIMPAGTWYTAFVTDGLLSGVFVVLSFVPQILLLFLFLSILEDTGYMARVAFIMDRALKRFGLSGRALMPLLMCFGCAVPGILGTRTLGNDAERRRTIFLTPFFSCGAKLPIWAAFAGVFASKYISLSAEITVFTIYIIGIVIAILAAIFLKKTVIKGEPQTFIMELPSYHLPQIKGLLIHLAEKLKHYITRAATVIALAVSILWFFSSFNFRLEYTVDTSDSILGMLSKILSYLFIPLGWGLGENGWKFLVAALSGIVAKEMVVATLGTLSGITSVEGVAFSSLLLSIGGTLGALDVSIPAMFSFLAFNLLSVPCASAVAAARSELLVGDKKQGRKYFIGAIVFWITTAYVVSLTIFWFGTLAVYSPWIAVIVGISIALIIIVLIILKARKLNNVVVLLKESGKSPDSQNNIVIEEADCSSCKSCLGCLNKNYCEEYDKKDNSN